MPAATIPPQVQGVFPILKLPYELRRSIWEYVLATKQGLFYHYERNDSALKLFTRPRKFDNVENHDAQYDEVNKIKYLCHQVHKDTRGLALKVNDITFTRQHIHEPEPEIQFLDFVKLCSEKSIGNLRTVSLMPMDLVQEKMYLHRPVQINHDLATFCFRHPKIQVKQYMLAFRHTCDYSTQFEQAVILKHQVGRGEMDSQIRDGLKSVYNETISNIQMKDYSSWGGFPTNLRFRSWDCVFEDWEWIYTQGERLDTLSWELEPDADEDVWALVVEEARGWYEQGI